MKIIRTQKDMNMLRQTGALPPTSQAYVDALFAQLEEALGEGEPELSLDQHGLIVLLEAEDDPRRLHGVGLDHLDQGLLSTWPEYVEKVDLDGLLLYRGLVIYDNECGNIFLGEKGHLDPELEAWLEDQASESTESA